MPPVSVKVMGNVGVSLSVKFIWPATVTPGFPLTIRFETEQSAGVIVRLALTEPLPEVFRVPSISPVTEMVPPEGPLQGASVREMGKLQFSPVAVEVQPLNVSG